MLDSLTGRAATTPSFVTLKFDRKGTPTDEHLFAGPVWTEQHGAAAGVDSLQDSLTYDGWGRVLTVTTYKNGSVIDAPTYAFDRDDNLTGLQVFTLTYDPTTSRLLQQTSGGPPSTSYAYDRAGNQVTLALNGTTWLTYHYNALNQLVAAYQGSTPIARYAYDVLGRRIAKRVYSSPNGGDARYARFVYDGPNVAFDADSGGTTGMRYTWAGVDDLVAIDSGATHYYVIQDLLHSVRGLVRRDGAWVFSQRFGSYGGAGARDSNPATPIPDLRYRWTGREYDPETGFYYFRARYYSSTQHRFVQEDPIGHAGGGNLYAYGAGNPVHGRDPSGLAMEDALQMVNLSTGIRDCTAMSVEGGPASCVGGAGMGLLLSADEWERQMAWVRNVRAAEASSCGNSLAAAGNAGCQVDAGDVERFYQEALLAANEAWADNVVWRGQIVDWDPKKPMAALPPVFVKIGNPEGFQPGMWNLDHYKGETSKIRFFGNLPGINLAEMGLSPVSSYEGYFYPTFPYHTPTGIILRVPAMGYVFHNGQAIFSADRGNCGCW